jgi:hypothetical protein
MPHKSHPPMCGPEWNPPRDGLAVMAKVHDALPKELDEVEKKRLFHSLMDIVQTCRDSPSFRAGLHELLGELGLSLKFAQDNK